MKKKIDVEDMLRLDDLTVEEVQSFPMFEDFTDQQAREVIETVKRFTEIIYKCYLKTKETP